MKKITTTFCLLTMTFAFTFGQTSPDSIAMKKSIWWLSVLSGCAKIKHESTCKDDGIKSTSIQPN